MADVVLVTGAAGFVGRHLTAALEAAGGPTVVAWRRPHPARDPPGAPDGDRRVSWDGVDLLDRRRVVDAVAAIRPTAVYHCAGFADVGGSWRNVAPTLETNVVGTANLVDALRLARVEARLLIPGSALVYRPKPTALDEDDPVGPLSPYGLSKLAQEMVGTRAAADGQRVIVTRSFTHVGPGQSLAYAASSFAHQVAAIEAGRAEPVIAVGALDAERDLMDVRDTVAAYRALMARGTSGTVYNVCSGRAHRMQEVLDTLRRLSDVRIEVRVDPERLRPSDYPVLLGDPGRITRDTGWTPRIGLEETLRDLLDSWRRRMRAQS